MMSDLSHEKEIPGTNPPASEDTYIKDTIKFALIALAIVLPIRIFIAQPFIVSGQSMFPTFHDKEYLIVDQITYRLGEPKRGDVVIFKFPYEEGGRTKYYIKRIIGLPGETVEIQGTVVTIKNADHPEGFVLEEPYVEKSQESSAIKSLGDGQYFVMGDNRAESYDSRFWGPLDASFIVGRPIVRLLPFASRGIFPGMNRELADPKLLESEESKE